jgi:hypothetical protein
VVPGQHGSVTKKPMLSATITRRTTLLRPGETTAPRCRVSGSARTRQPDTPATMHQLALAQASRNSFKRRILHFRHSARVASLVWQNWLQLRWKQQAMRRRTNSSMRRRGGIGCVLLEKFLESRVGCAVDPRSGSSLSMQTTGSIPPEST